MGGIGDYIGDAAEGIGMSTGKMENPYTKQMGQLADKGLGNSTNLNMDFGKQIQDQQNYAQGLMNKYDQDVANNLAAIQNNYGRSADFFKGNQSNLVKQYEDLISGKAPSITGEWLKTGMNENLAAQQAQAASQRGSNPMAQRLLMQNAANANQQTAQQGATMGLQEKQSLMSGLGGLLGQYRGQDIQDLLRQQNYDLGMRNNNLGLRGLGKQAWGTGLDFTKGMSQLGFGRDLGQYEAQLRALSGAGQGKQQQVENFWNFQDKMADAAKMAAGMPSG